MNVTGTTERNPHRAGRLQPVAIYWRCLLPAFTVGIQ